MNKKELEAFAKQAAKGIKSEQDLTDFRKILTKITVEAALNAELEEHLGYALHEKPNTNNINIVIISNFLNYRLHRRTIRFIKYFMTIFRYPNKVIH